MYSYLSINNLGIFFSVFAMFLVIIISSVNRLGLSKEIIVGTIRSFLQLFLMGFILKLTLENSLWYVTIVLFILMLLFASREAYKRIKFKNRKIFYLILLSLTIGSIIPLGIIFYLIIRVKPWYNIRFIIPISGMIIANSMTALSLGLNNYFSEIESKKKEVITKLSLGASPKDALSSIFKSSYYNGLLPSINALMVLGIAKLPGMMSGQIVAGVAPLESVKYQLMIMYMISFSTALSLFLLLKLSQNIVFNKRDQLEL